MCRRLVNARSCQTGCQRRQHQLLRRREGVPIDRPVRLTDTCPEVLLSAVYGQIKLTDTAELDCHMYHYNSILETGQDRSNARVKGHYNR